MHETFRLRKSVAYAGMALSAIFLAVCVLVASMFFLENPAEHGFKGEHSVAIVCGMALATFGTMFLLSLYMWSAYYLERFCISGSTISLQTMVQNHSFDATELVSLRWRTHPHGGSVLFRGRDFKGRLDLAGYRSEDRLRLIRALRAIVPPSVQEGWPMFCYGVALGLRDDRLVAPPPEPAGKTCVVTRRRYDRMLAAALPLSLCMAVAAGIYFGFWRAFVLPAAIVAAWLLLRFHVPPEGQVDWRVTTTEVGRTSLATWSVIVGTKLMMIGILLAGFEQRTACSAGCVVLLAAFPFLIFRMYRADRQRQARVPRLAELAVAQWDAGESQGNLETPAPTPLTLASSADRSAFIG